MRRILNLIACLLVYGIVAASAQTADTSAAKLRIAWDDFKQQYDKNEVVVIDVRSAEAFEQGHIPGSRPIPLDRVEQHVEELKSLKKPIVVYCA